jgi:hypothetical protein
MRPRDLVWALAAEAAERGTDADRLVRRVTGWSAG